MKVTKGSIPKERILSARFDPAEIMTGQFPSRFARRVPTGVHVEVPKGYKLCIQLVESLTQRGMVAANAPGNFTNGEVHVDIVNAGKEIVVINSGDPLCHVWVEEILNWEVPE